MTEKLLDTFKNQLAGVEIVPSGGGVFEVTRDGELLFSKKQTGRFPEWEEIRSAL